jgi:hypothetical protein
MSTELEAENARLRAELEAVTKQRNSAHRKAKSYFRKWKRLSQEQDAAPTALDMVRKHLAAVLDRCRRSVKDAFRQEDVDWSQAQVFVLESFQSVIPQYIQRAAPTPKPPKPPKRRDPADEMQEWLKSQVEYKKQSRNDVSYGWGDCDDDDRLYGEQEAYENALNELQRFRKIS